MKGVEAQRVKPSTPSQATNALTGDEEQNGKQKRAKTKKQGAGSQPSHPGPYIYYSGVTPAGSPQRYNIAGGSGEEERQETLEE